MKLLLEKIVSGGQTGADFSALIAAQKLGIKTGGWAPKGFRTENGSNPDLGSVYGLQEHSSDKYPPRTMANVDFSDGTLSFLFRNSPGTKYTIGYCHTQQWVPRPTTKIDGYRPVLVISRITDKTIDEIRSFITENNIHVLNVAGHRESSYPGIQDRVSDLLQKALRIED